MYDTIVLYETFPRSLASFLEHKNNFGEEELSKNTHWPALSEAQRECKGRKN